MAGESNKAQEDVLAAEKNDSATIVKKKQKGLISRIWNGLFRRQGDDFEKRLQHISKEEATILARMKKRSLSWRRMIRYLIILSVIFETSFMFKYVARAGLHDCIGMVRGVKVIAVVYAIMTTRSLHLNWKMRAFRVLPMFLLPGLSSITYSALVTFTRMCDRKDQKTLERLRAERQEKIDELKEKTNYYITQQLIQRYDPDPAAKAAAASVLASKLGSDSGLKVYLGDDSKLNAPTGKSNDVEIVPSTGLRNRNHPQTRPSGTGSPVLQHTDEQMLHKTGNERSDTSEHNQLVVEHHNPGSTTQDGGWIAWIAALLVGEDPTQSYALICGNCHMHNGLARKEDFPYIVYYCPHCNALNRSKDLGVSGSNSPNMSPEIAKSSMQPNNSAVAVSEIIPASSSPVTAAVENVEGSGRLLSGDLAPISPS